MDWKVYVLGLLMYAMMRWRFPKPPALKYSILVTMVPDFAYSKFAEAERLNWVP